MKLIIDLDKATGHDCRRLRKVIAEIREREMQSAWDAAWPGLDIRYFVNVEAEAEVFRVDRNKEPWARVHVCDLDTHKKEWRQCGMPDGCYVLFNDHGGVEKGFREITEDPLVERIEQYPFA